MVGRICPPPGGDRVKIFENLGATTVVPVAPVGDTSRQNFYNALVVVIDCWVVGGQLFSALECVIKAKSREKRY